MPTDPIKVAIKGSTQQHLPIEDIVDDIVMLKDGSCAVVMQLSSVNFDLLSEREQSALVYAYGGILNSLNFPIQIVIRSNTKDVSAYLTMLSRAEEKQVNPLLKERISSYRKFISETVKKNDVLAKSFYIAVPFSSLELGIKGAGKEIGKSLFSFGKTGEDEKLPFDKNYILERARASLDPKRDHIIRLFSRLGLDIRPLTKKELVDLFYAIYNEETAINQKVANLNFDNPIVTGKLRN